MAGIDAPEVTCRLNLYYILSNEHGIIELARGTMREQPYAQEALKWMRRKVLGKVVYCQLLMRDKYGRAVRSFLQPLTKLADSSGIKVAAVMLPKGFWSRLFPTVLGTPLAHEILRVGYAVVYRDNDAAYGPGGLEGHLAIEEIAKSVLSNSLYVYTYVLIGNGRKGSGFTAPTS